MIVLYLASRPFKERKHNVGNDFLLSYFQKFQILCLYVTAAKGSINIFCKQRNEKYFALN